jgi:hypothetical protein
MHHVLLLLLLAGLQPADLANKSLDELRMMRGEVFGRHGRIFAADADIDRHLRAQSWYKPNHDYMNDALSADDRANLDLIREAEANHHEHVEPGDMRWWQKRELTEQELGDHNGLELRVMLAEIEAIHGRTFEGSPTLQRYFSDRYWYEAKIYNPNVLSETERHNMAVIESAMKRQRKVVLLPGDMGAYRDNPITAAMLDGVGLHELRLLRNEIYARRGYSFKSAWLANWFAAYDWYVPLDKQPQLSTVEKNNAALIAAREREMHDALSSKKIDPAMLEGLFTEDLKRLRNEVFARHGRTFKDADLRGYFSSFPWYKPDPSYKEAALSPIELANVEVIRRLEEGADSRISFEG